MEQLPKITESEFKRIFAESMAHLKDKAKDTDVWDVLPCGDNHYNFVNKHGGTLAILPAKDFDEAMRAEISKRISNGTT